MYIIINDNNCVYHKTSTGRDYFLCGLCGDLKVYKTKANAEKCVIRLKNRLKLAGRDDNGIRAISMEDFYAKR